MNPPTATGMARCWISSTSALAHNPGLKRRLLHGFTAAGSLLTPLRAGQALAELENFFVVPVV